MAGKAYTFDRDCSLDLSEAIQLLELLFFTLEQADNEQDWFAMRGPIGSGLHAAQQSLYAAQKKVEAPSASKAAH